MPVGVAIPDDPPLVAYSINRGVPLVMSHPRSAVSRRILNLAHLVARAEEKEKEPAEEGGLKAIASKLTGALRPRHA
ncbi:MAG TPA: hypothetical protein EYP04_13115 [Anaerolineae bacterium]|nr:hypothetical protein [Anaerolineae bacterium]